MTTSKNHSPQTRPADLSLGTGDQTPCSQAATPAGREAESSPRNTLDHSAGSIATQTHSTRDGHASPNESHREGALVYLRVRGEGNIFQRLSVRARNEPLTPRDATIVSDTM